MLAADRIKTITLFREISGLETLSTCVKAH